jgi:hypothetical protein
MGKKYIHLLVIDADDDSKVEAVVDTDLDSHGSVVIKLLGRAIKGEIEIIKNNEKNDRFYSSLGRLNPDSWKPK